MTVELAEERRPVVLVWRRRTRRLRLTVRSDGEIAVSVPWRLSREAAIALAERFLHEHSGWLRRTLHDAGSNPVKRLFSLGREDYLRRREEARRLVNERLVRLNTHYGYRYGRISIRNQRSRWGSASRSGDLSFNYRLIYLPLVFVDYVVAHELCHLREPNHSARFWALVRRAIPDHRTLRARLRAGDIA